MDRARGVTVQSSSVSERDFHARCRVDRRHRDGQTPSGNLKLRVLNGSAVRALAANENTENAEQSQV